jgi:hypothetical protein
MGNLQVVRKQIRPKVGIFLAGYDRYISELTENERWPGKGWLRRSRPGVS